MWILVSSLVEYLEHKNPSLVYGTPKPDGEDSGSVDGVQATFHRGRRCKYLEASLGELDPHVEATQILDLVTLTTLRKMMTRIG